MKEHIGASSLLLLFVENTISALNIDFGIVLSLCLFIHSVSTAILFCSQTIKHFSLFLNHIYCYFVLM